MWEEINLIVLNNFLLLKEGMVTNQDLVVTTNKHDDDYYL